MFLLPNMWLFAYFYGFLHSKNSATSLRVVLSTVSFPSVENTAIDPREKIRGRGQFSILSWDHSHLSRTRIGPQGGSKLGEQRCQSWLANGIADLLLILTFHITSLLFLFYSVFGNGFFNNGF